MSDRFVVHLDDLFTVESHSQQFLTDVQGNCVVTNGCFDILHPGHLHLLRRLQVIAGMHSLRPVVAMNSDASVRLLKGLGRPVVPQQARSELLSTLQWPFVVVIFDEKTPQRLMDTLRPSIVLKGAEYSAESVIRWHGSRVVTMEQIPHWSTTGILNGRS